MATRKAPHRFEESTLLAKIKELARRHEFTAVEELIEATVPADQLADWLWSARARGLIARPWSHDALFARHVDRVSPELFAAAITGAEQGLGQHLPSVEAPAMWLLQACCRAGKAETLLARTHALPPSHRLAVWVAIASVERERRAPPEVVAEVVRALPAHASSGAMKRIEMGLIADWLGVEPSELYAAGKAALQGMERVPLAPFGCVLFQMPRAEVIPVFERLDIDGVQPGWMAWWMEARLSFVDSAADSLAVLDALRPALLRVSEMFLAWVLDEAGLVAAKALVAAGEPLPGWLLEVPTSSDTFIERWRPVHKALPRERLRALRARLRAVMPPLAQAQILGMAPLFGPEAINLAIAETEEAIARGNSVTNGEVGFLGAIGHPVIAPLAARIDELSRGLPRESLQPADYRRLAVVVGLRCALCIALGSVAEGGEPIDERFDRFLLPSKAVFGTGHDDHVYRFFSQSSDRQRRLFARLPEPRLAAFVDAWREFDPTEKHFISERLAMVIPRERLAPLEAGPSRVERLRKAAAETGLPCTLSVYALTRDAKRRAGALDTIGARPLGLAPRSIPRAGKKKMAPVLSLDLAGLPELAARFPGARALCLFVDRPEDGFESSALVPLDAATCEAGFSSEGATFMAEEIKVPPEVFAESGPEGERLGSLRSGLDALSGRALGKPSFLQSKPSATDGAGFILQADEGFTRINLGDSGTLYLYETGAFWECR